MMTRLKSFLSALWKIIPGRWRWRLLWLSSDRFIVSVTGVVLNARDQVLLAHHVYRKDIVWGALGGGVKHGESLEHALRREILEETGLAVRVTELLQVDLDPRYPAVNVWFSCTVDGTPQPRANEELFEVGFYSLDRFLARSHLSRWL